MSNINSCGMETPMDHQTLQHPRGTEPGTLAGAYSSGSQYEDSL